MEVTKNSMRSQNFHNYFKENEADDKLSNGSSVSAKKQKLRIEEEVVMVIAKMKILTVLEHNSKAIISKSKLYYACLNSISK